MSPRHLLAPATAMAALLLAAAPAPAAKRTHYLSLGDSLAWGQTRASDGTVAQSDFDYTNQLAQRARDSRKRFSRLRTHRMGCPGEDTTTFRQGGKCDFGEAGSQLRAAKRFLRQRGKRVAFVTLSVGANNFTSCQTAEGGVDLGCVIDGNQRLDRDLPKIYRGLRRAAHRRVKIVTATQYNPYLASWLQGTESDRQLAALTNDLVAQVNAKIRAAARHRKARLRLARVDRAFDTFAMDEMVPFGDFEVPKAVAAVCSFTLMCQLPPVGPDIHPTAGGYTAMADAFARRLPVR